MSKQVTVGEFTLETSGDQIVVRDATGGIVETVDIDDLNGELMLPTGQRIDVAALLADPAIEGFQTAAGGQPGVETAPGSPNGGPSAFRAFNGESGDYSARGSAGALGDTSLDYSTPGPNATQFFEPNQEQSILVTWASHEPWQIEENQGGGVFGKVVNGNPADFTFEVSDSRFEVVDGVLRVRNGYAFNFENEPGIDLQITATSRTGDVQTLKTHIDVTDVNEEQTALTLDNAAVDENAAGAVIGNLNVADPDADDQQSFAVSDGRFEVVNGQLKLKDGVALDHEGEGSVSVTVTATDKGGHQIAQTFAIQIGDVNEAPTDIDLSGSTLVENVAGAVVGTLTAIDPDAGDSHTFQVSDNRFEVVNGQLKLKDGVSIDFENEPTLNVVVTATDAGGKSVQETFTLSVEGVNEAQTSLTIDNTEISENAAGAVVGTLTVMDPDAGDSQSFEVSDNRFEVVNGQLKLKDGVSLDHESEPSVSVKVTATDSDGHQIAQTFAIDVGDVNEAQTAMTFVGKAKVAENVAGAVIGTISVADPDAGDVQSFKVSDDRFEVSNGQLKLKDGVSLNFEAGNSVSVTVTATDAGGHEISKTVNVGVTNVNEAQTSLTLSKSTVNENAKGAVIGTLTVVDPDAGDKQSFTVSDSRFQVVNGQLKLKSGVAIDYETEPSIDVKVTATDKSGHQISETFKIDVADVNEKQTAIALTGNTVAENAKGAVIGTVSVSDPDAGDVQSYKVSDNRFEVVNGQLKLKDGVSLNYETAATVNVKVTATDAGNHAISKTFAINVGDVNEAQTNMTLTGNKVSENAAGAVVGTLKVTDPDKGDAQSFSVSDNRFEVVNGQLKLKDGVSLNYEAGSKVAVDVTATDMAGHQITKTYNVNVGNVWEAQTDMTLSASNVKENAAGATIGTLKVTDPDAGDKQTYTVSDSRFEVVNSKLKLKAGVSLDHEADATVEIDVTATDKGGNQITKSYTINVADVNEAQTAITIDNMSIAENTKGAVVGTLSVADQDVGDVQTFKVSDNRFEVVNGQLKVKAGISFDHETTPSIDVTVTATDKGKHNFAQTFTVSIADVNEAQTGMALIGQQVAENQAGAVIGTVSVTDPDVGDMQSFQVSDPRFEVVNGELKLKDGISLDHEAEGTVSVTITATDKGGHQISQSYQIQVGDANDAQTSISISNSLVSENAAGAVVGKITVVDPDAGDSQSFQVSDPRFEVVNGELKLKDGQSLDHEAEGSVTVTVKATDSAGHEIAQDFKITVGDENEAQTGMILGNSQVMENNAGAVIGTITVNDPDAGDSQSFQVSDPRFEVVNGELKLKDGQSLDHEAEGSVSVTVTATDGGAHQYSKTFTITVGDANEAQTGMSLSASQVAENAAGAVIGTLSVNDPDAGDSQSFQVSDPRFEVVNGQLKLKDGQSLDHESEGSVNVTVTATDGGNHQYSKTFSITVGDVNEAQTGMSLSASKVTENQAGAVVGTLAVSDPDAGDTQSFAVSDSRFEVVNNQLKLKSGQSLDYEAGSTVNVTVTATDGGNHQYSKTFAINVGNVNEAQTAITPTGAMRVSENAAGAVAGGIVVSDPDAGDKQTFTVSDNRFEVVNNTLKLKDGVSLNYEAASSVNVTVTATDMGGNQISKTIAVGVDDVNEKQTSISFFGSNIAENTTTTTNKMAVAGTILVTDPDAGDAQTYTVSDSRFQVVNNQLVLKPGASLNYETEPTVNVTITATDKGGNQISTTATVNVTNVNEAQTGMSLSASKVAENTSGTTVGTLTTIDPDANDSQTYTVSDSRFEVVNNQLKLKSGQSLNYETESSVNVTVTAKDTGGNTYSKAFTIGVTDVNEVQTGMSLSASKVAENSAGATIGTLTTTDPDANDSQTYQVSDNRFEVVNSQLKLKSGVSLDYEAGSTINVTVTATDKGQNQYSKSFAVTVTDVNEIAPVVVAKDGHIENHVYDTVTTYTPNANATVGSYLYSNDSAGAKAPAASDLTAIDGANMTLQMETEVQVTFQKEAAGNRNMVGTYQYDDSGNIIAGSVKFVWLDASANTEGQLGSTMVKDFLGYQQSNTVSLGTMDAGTHVGFFTISNGAADSANRSLLTTAASGTTTQVAAMDAIESQLSIKVDANGNGQVYVGNTQMNGAVFFTHDKSLNTDFNGANDIVHMTSGVSSKMPSQLMIGVEDLAGGGDKDFNDVVFSVNLGSYDINKTVSNAVQPTVDFSDADSSTLTQATIQTSGFQSGDVLTIPTSSLFNVSVTHTTAEYTITITGKNGGETIDQYESFVNSISFSTSSKVEGDRHIDYSVTDNGGLKSTVDRADISVDSDYHVSTSELSGGKTTFNDGADDLYINTSSFGPVDMGDGHDTVHLAQAGRGFDHNDAVKLSNIEELDTTGYGVNKVSLNISDVLNMTDDDNQLTVIGDKGDVVTLESSGKGKWEVTGQDAEFTTYHYSDSSHEAIVQISNQLTAQIG